MALKTDVLIVAGVALALLGAAWYAKRKVGEAVDSVGNVISDTAETVWGAAKDASVYVNPTSDKNLAYQGVNKVGETMTGDKDFSLGVWIYDKTH